MDDNGKDRHGALSRRRTVAVMGTYRARHAQETGVLTAPWPGVLVPGDRADDPLTLAAAALEYAGPTAVLFGTTAAHLHGCASAAALPVQLLVPYEHHLRTRPGLVVHNGPLPDDDRTEVRGLPVLRLGRAVADVLCRERPDTALAIADEALARVGAADRERFRREVAERLRVRSDPRGTVRGARLLALATGRAESPPESWLLFRVVDAGYPVPEVNWSLPGIDGREIHRLDLAWPALRIAIEYHGYAAHIGRTAEDEARAEDIRRRGWIYIDVWADELAGVYEPELDEAFRRRGVDMSRRRPGVLQARRHREVGDRRRPR